MHFYDHNIKTFNNATRHLTRVERSLYRDAIELYYDTEQPLPAADFDTLARRLLANSDEERAALRYVLSEFFELTGEVYTHHFCDEVIEKYRANNSQKSKAGKASAAARRKKAETRKAARKGKPQSADEHTFEQNSTGVEQTLNERATNHKPETSNQLEDKTYVRSPAAQSPDQDDSPTVATLQTNRFNTTGETFRVTEAMLPDWEEAFPSVNIRQAILQAKTWLQDNPTKRKTLGGMRKFLNSWFSRQQDKGAPNGNAKGHAGQAQDTRRLSGAEQTRLAREAARERERGASRRQSDLGCVGEPESSVPWEHGKLGGRSS